MIKAKHVYYLLPGMTYHFCCASGGITVLVVEHIYSIQISLPKSRWLNDSVVTLSARSGATQYCCVQLFFSVSYSYRVSATF